MSHHVNSFGQPVGAPEADWSPRSRPDDVTLQGRFCRLEPLNVDRHGVALFDAYSLAKDARDWTYMALGPFDDVDAYLRHVESAAHSTDPKHYVIIDQALDRPVGTFALMRIEPAHGVVEVGFVAFSPLLQQKPASTEAQYLLMKYVFDELKYRRYEWKCDLLNAPSRKTAERLGFTFEGVFRQAMVYKGRTRDSAWFSIIDKEWPVIRQAFESWLSADNFDASGRQRRSLAAIRQTPSAS